MDPRTQPNATAGAGEGYSDDGFEPVASNPSLTRDNAHAGNGDQDAGYSEDGFESAASNESLHRDTQGHQGQADSHTPPLPDSHATRQRNVRAPTRPAKPSSSVTAPSGTRKGKGPLPPVGSHPSGRGRNIKSKPESNSGRHANTQPNSGKQHSRTSSKDRRSPSPTASTSPRNQAAAGNARPMTGSGAGALKRLMSIENFPTIQPVANRLLAERWEKKRFNLHQKALREAQATVDDSCPGSFGEWRLVNPKKVQMERDRQSLIDHRNTLLLGKFHQVADATHREYAVNPQATKLRETLSDRVHTRRVKQLHTIDSQNETLLRRIDGKSSVYRVSSWTVERLQTLYYLINVSDHKSKYVQEMVRLSESLVAAGQVLPPNIWAVVEPLIGSSSGGEQQQLPKLSSTSVSSETRQGSAVPRSASGSTRLKPIGAGGQPVNRDREGQVDTSGEVMRVVDV